MVTFYHYKSGVPVKAIKFLLVGAVSVFLLLGITLLLAPGFDGPLSRIAGGQFQQASETHPVDAQKLKDLANIELEVNLPSRSSVTVAVVVHNNKIYLPATLTPSEKRWPNAILKDPGIRIRVDGKVYDFNAYRVTETRLHKQLSDMGAEKYSRSYFIPENTWFFQLQERQRVKEQSKLASEA